MKKITVTIGIPAHNEEKTIGSVLRFLLDQKQKEFVIENIYVISDGSTDNTNMIVSKMANRKITLIADSNRLGKNARLTFLFKKSTSDYLVIVDADVTCNDEFLLSKIIKTSQKSSADLTMGNVLPLPSQTLVERGINNFVNSLTSIKNTIHNGNNIYSMRGPFYCLSKALYKNLKVPSHVPDDRYIYLYTKKKGYKTVFAKVASVYFRSPQTIKDQYEQGKRFLSDKKGLSKYFSTEFIDNEYFLPFSLRLRLLFSQLHKDPFAYFVLKFIHIKSTLSSKDRPSMVWEKITTSQNL